MEFHNNRFDRIKRGVRNTIRTIGFSAAVLGAAVFANAAWSAHQEAQTVKTAEKKHELESDRNFLGLMGGGLIVSSLVITADDRWRIRYKIEQAERYGTLVKESAQQHERNSLVQTIDLARTLETLVESDRCSPEDLLLVAQDLRISVAEHNLKR